MSPVEVAKALVDADSRYAVAEVTSLVHMAAADRFRRRQLAALETVPWAELKNRAGPRAKRLQAAVQHNQDYVLKIAYRVGTLDEFRAMPAMEILRRRLAEAYRAQSPATRSRLIVTGSVPRDTETEYVVIERRPDFEHAANMPPLRVEVMTLKNTEGVWQSMLDGGLQSGELFVLGAENFGQGLPA